MKRFRNLRFPALLLAILMLTPLLACCSGGEPGIDRITSYTEIPNITGGEIDKIEAVKAGRKAEGSCIIYGQVLETEAFEQPGGEKAGFTAKLCALLTQLFDIEFRLEICSWTYLVGVPEREGVQRQPGALEKKEVDFTGDLTYKPERVNPTDGTPPFFMSHTIAERSFRIFYLTGPEYKDEKQLGDLRIGVLKGLDDRLENSVDYVHIKTFYPDLDFEPVLVDDFGPAMEMLLAGDIDVFASEGVIDPLFDDERIESKEFFPLIYNPVSLSTQNPELEPFITVIDKYLEAGGIDKLYELYKEGDYEYAKYKLAKSFSASETAYLDSLRNNGRKVKIALEHDNYPISFYNDKEKEYQGVALEVFTEVCGLLDIGFDVVTDKTMAWPSIIEMLASGAIDMAEELLVTPEREASGQFLWAYAPYASSNYALLSKSDYPDLANYQVLRTKVGVVSQSGHEAMYNKWFPGNNNTKTFKTQYEALSALEKGEVDLLMGSEYMLLTQTNYLEKPGYKINIRFNEPMESYFGFNKNRGDLRSVVSKAQSHIKIAEIERAWSSKVFDYSKKLANQRSLFLLMIAVVTLIAAGLVVFFLYKNSRRKTAEHAAQAASKSKSAFLARMSHEIRTPLNAIIGMANIANQSVSDHEKTLWSIRRIISSSQHLLGILNDVLDMSKIESGKLELVITPFSLIDAAREVSDMIGQRCGEKNISFVTNLDEFENVTVAGDKLRLNQVLINLLGNAVKFTSPGGEVKLLLEKLKEDGSRIRIKFSVCDNGIGMTPEQTARLFIPFEQADSSIATRFGGTGLGLSISQNLIDMMGGTIKAESRQNEGSKFYFELDFEKRAVSKEGGEDEGGVPELTGKRILMVEDIEINRIILGEVLQPTGAALEEAEDGQAAVDIFNKSKEGYFDLIFMDIQMPVMNGYESAKAIRSLNRADAASVPIIAMTANAYKEDVDQAIAAGMNGHLSKPIDVNAVYKSLKENIK